MLLGQPSEVDSVHEVHGQVVDAVDVPGVVGGDDIGVVEPADGPHLVLEPGQANLGEVAGRQHLEGYHLAELDVPSLVNGPHATGGELLEDLVAAEAPAGEPGRVQAGLPADPGRRFPKPSQEALIGLRVGTVRAGGTGCRGQEAWGAQACEMFLASAAHFDVRLDGIALRSGEVFGEQPFQNSHGGARGLVRCHGISSVRRESVAELPGLYYRAPVSRPTCRFGQAKGESVPLPFWDVPEGLYLGLDGRTRSVRRKRG